jgi:DNA-binding SARP family transcriptional activator/tetratricopeptide (TPR) repeat protein
MNDLRILGSASLEGPGERDPGVLASQPKRLALLAFLAVEGRPLVARDRLLGMFWPEHSEERARHALNQALHVLRRVLGTDAIVARGNQLGIDAGRIECDAVAFNEALKCGDEARAVALYRGSFLDGVYLSDAVEFERWLDETRAGFQRQAAAAAARVADAAIAEGNSSAESLARRAAELTPYDDAGVRRLVQLLDGLGKRAEAITAFDGYARRLRLDCELSPGDDLRALVTEVRGRTPHIDTAIPIVPVARATAAMPGQDAKPIDVALGAPRPRSWLRTALSAASVGLAGVGLWSLAASGAGPASAGTLPAAVDQVAVQPFTGSQGGAGDATLGQSVVALLVTRLDGAGSIHATPADAVPASQSMRGNAAADRRSVIHGTIVQTGSTLQLRASWQRTAAATAFAEASVEGNAAALPTLLDSLAIKLLAQAELGPDRALTRVAIQTAPSLAAAKAYLVGDEAFANGSFAAATRAFEQAAADTNFALAQYRLGVAALWAQDYPMAASDAGARALRHAVALPDHVRRLLKGFDAWRRGDNDSALWTFRSILATDRDNVEAWFQLGETEFHYNPIEGRPIAESREAFQRVLELSPNHWGAIWHLALLDASAGRIADMDRDLRRLAQIRPANDYTLEIPVLSACAHQDTAALGALVPALRRAGDGRVIDMAWRCAVYGRDLRGTETIARVLTAPERGRYSEGCGRRILASLALARGQTHRAAAELDSLARGSPGIAMLDRVRYALIPDLAATAAARDQLDSTLQQWNEPPTGWVVSEDWGTGRAYALGRLAVARGRSADALAQAAVVASRPDPADAPGLNHVLAQQIRAEVMTAAGNGAGAMEAVTQQRARIWLGSLVPVPAFSRASARFDRGDQLAGSGRFADALGWYASIDEISIFDLAYAGPAHLRRARILERLADTTGALREYSTFIDLWKNAEPPGQRLVSDARERIAELRAMADK